MTHQAFLAHFIHVFENLSQDDVRSLTAQYSADAYFKDPFNEVCGHAAIIGIFEHMFKQIGKPKFTVTSSILQGDDAFIVWDFSFRSNDGAHVEQHIHGSSHLRFGADHRVHYHRDYWDTAEELYEKVPVLGSLMRFLKCRMRS
jgi:hypothetical protein